MVFSRELCREELLQAKGATGRESVLLGDMKSYHHYVVDPIRLEDIELVLSEPYVTLIGSVREIGYQHHFARLGESDSLPPHRRHWTVMRHD